jgi:hypothetical protein
MAGRTSEAQRHRGFHRRHIEDIVALLQQHPDGPAGKYAGRLRKEVERVFAKTGDAVSLGDFRAYMPRHAYIYTPSGELWPGASVNARIGAIVLADADGTPILEKRAFCSFQTFGLGLGAVGEADQKIQQRRHARRTRRTWLRHGPHLVDLRLAGATATRPICGCGVVCTTTADFRSPF